MCNEEYSQMVRNNKKKRVYNLSWNIKGLDHHFIISERSKLKNRRRLCRSFGEKLKEKIN